MMNHGPDEQYKLEFNERERSYLNPPLEVVLTRLPRRHVYRCHSGPTFNLLNTIEQLSRISIIITRHPADSIVAIFCNDRGKTGSSTAKSRLFDNSVTLVPAESLTEQDVDKGLTSLIEGGALRDLLLWYERWFQVAARVTMTVVRSEDISQSPIPTLHAVADKIFPGTRISDEAAQSLKRETSEFRRIREVDAARYPRGYSGKTNVWKDYFSPPMIASYRRIVHATLSLCPNLKRLQTLYPDLLLADQ